MLVHNKINEEQLYRTLLENHPDGIARLDVQGRHLYVSQAALEATGTEFSTLSLLGKTVCELPIPGNPELMQPLLDSVLKVVATAAVETIEFAWRNGKVSEFRYIPELNEQGDVSSVLAIARDITAIKKTESQLRSILDTLPDVIVRYDRECRRIYVNHEFEKINGLRAKDVLGKPPEERSGKIAPIATDYQARLKAVFESGEPVQCELESLNEDGSKTVQDLRLIPEYGMNGEVSSVLTIGRDISEIKHAAALLKTKEREFRTLVENSPDIIVRYDRDCRRIFVNEAYVRQTGTPVESAFNNSIDDASTWRPTMSPEEYRDRLQQVMDSGMPDKVLWEWERYDGQHVSHEMYVVAEYDADGKVIGALALGRDVTRSKDVEQQLIHQASYDLLTGLPNRRLLDERLLQDIAHAKRGGTSLGLLIVDLDRFKIINDTMGHEIGDQLLMGVAQRIRQCVRDSDTVARLAGDEFVVILPGNCGGQFLTRVARSITDIIAQPFYFEHHHTHISACIGIAIYPQDADTVATLISSADQAMYAAKKTGPNNFSFFTYDMLSNAKQRIHLANELCNALNKGQMEVYYQPIVDVVSGQTFKAEALLRWHHPELGIVPPDQFIPLAEETELIQDIGHWVFREALEAAKQWNMSMEDGHLRQISINMSPRQFRKGDVDQQIIDYLKTHQHNPAHIAIEITEGLLLDDSADITSKLDNLRAAGFEISLDDFGTGYSAMAYLKKFNLDYLKIDRSFVIDLETDSAAQAIAEAIVVLAHRLGLKVIAEGVETAGQYELLAAMNCEYMQGYLFAKPMPLEQFISFLAEGICSIRAYSNY